MVLSRHRNERIVVTASNGERITITVVDIRGDKTRIGLDGPTSVKIHREEVQNAIEREAKIPPLSGLMPGAATARAG